MEHRIISAIAHPDFTVELVIDGGERATVDLGGFVATGVVTEPLRRDLELFVSGLRVEGEGEWIAWPGEVEIDADALWYTSHPDDLRRDFGPEAA